MKKLSKRNTRKIIKRKRNPSKLNQYVGQNVLISIAINNLTVRFNTTLDKWQGGKFAATVNADPKWSYIEFIPDHVISIEQGNDVIIIELNPNAFIY